MLNQVKGWEMLRCTRCGYAIELCSVTKDWDSCPVCLKRKRGRQPLIEMFCNKEDNYPAIKYKNTFIPGAHLEEIYQEIETLEKEINSRSQEKCLNMASNPKQTTSVLSV